MTDITPDIPAGRMMIEAYGGGGFTIGGSRIRGSVLVFPERVAPWPVTRFEDISLESLAEITAEAAKVELLLIGCGGHFRPAPPALLEALRGMGVMGDFMDTGAACRTFNVLLAENRRVAAALIAVD